jgi:hypothetical protein
MTVEAREGASNSFPTAKVIIKKQTAKGFGSFNIILTQKEISTTHHKQC